MGILYLYWNGTYTRFVRTVAIHPSGVVAGVPVILVLSSWEEDKIMSFNQFITGITWEMVRRLIQPRMLAVPRRFVDLLLLQPTIWQTGTIIIKEHRLMEALGSVEERWQIAQPPARLGSGIGLSIKGVGIRVGVGGKAYFTNVQQPTHGRFTIPPIPILTHWSQGPQKRPIHQPTFK